MTGGLAGRSRAVVTVRATVRSHVLVVEFCGRPCRGAMTGIAGLRGRQVVRGLTGCGRTVVTTGATLCGDGGMVESRGHPRARTMARLASCRDRNMRRRRARGIGQTTAVAVTTGAILRRSLQDSAIMAAFAFRIAMRSGERKTGLCVIEVPRKLRLSRAGR